MPDPANNEILFVLGSARSGTTYLNNFLARWFDYGMGPEGTFVAHFHRRLSHYGNLSNSQNLARLVNDISRCQMLEIMRKKYHPSKRIDVTPEMIHGRLLEPTYAGVVRAVFQCVADLQGKSRVGNKNPGFWTHLELLEDLFPQDAKYIAIVRDGRDVFLSLQGVPWGSHSVYIAAKRWRQALVAIERSLERCGSERFLVLRYENLLRSPTESIGKIEDMLGVTLVPEARLAALEEADNNPKKTNFHKWPDRMSENERRVFEAVAGDMLAKYGYETLPERPRNSLPEKLCFEVMELKRLVLINLYHMRHKFAGDTKRNAREAAAKKARKTGAPR